MPLPTTEMPAKHCRWDGDGQEGEDLGEELLGTVSLPGLFCRCEIHSSSCLMLNKTKEPKLELLGLGSNPPPQHGQPGPSRANTHFKRPRMKA